VIREGLPDDLSSERLTLRQAAQARDDFAQVMDELDFVKGAARPRPDAQGSSVYAPAHNARLGSPQLRDRHWLDSYYGGIASDAPTLKVFPGVRGCAR